MSDHEHDIRAALERRPDVGMVTGYLVAFEYLDDQGGRGIGFHSPDGQSILTTHALGVAAGRVAGNWLDEWIGDTDDD